MKNYKLFRGFGDYTAVSPTSRSVDDVEVFASLEDAEKAAKLYVAEKQAYQCSCGGLNPECPDCGGTGWL